MVAICKIYNYYKFIQYSSYLISFACIWYIMTNKLKISYESIISLVENFSHNKYNPHIQQSCTMCMLVSLVIRQYIGIHRTGKPETSLWDINPTGFPPPPISINGIHHWHHFPPTPIHVHHKMVYIFPYLEYCIVYISV